MRSFKEKFRLFLFYCFLFALLKRENISVIVKAAVIFVHYDYFNPPLTILFVEFVEIPQKYIYNKNVA